ncbi:MAG: YifB family Mg chelatase-like AAA ATPase, partial [Clostridia bacterium]|nr:YifB family Mg chelatase-like AAA ATPase [Clostridia bacterium]
IGELGLSGELRGINGVLSLVSSAKEWGIKKVFVPKDNAQEAALCTGIEVFGANCLSDVYSHLIGEVCIEPTLCDVNTIFNQAAHYDIDFSDVRGQAGLRRGIELCVSGGHNLLFIGTPGSGKSMLSQRIPTILPDMTLEEAIEVTKIYSVAGALEGKTNLIAKRPFRTPHHSASAVSIVGGGAKAKPGEISLAHNGVLFLDEFPEYRKDVIESMRQPLEDKKITVTRAAASYTYPCNAMLVVALNPCKCGYYGDGTNRCRCSESEVRKYLGKISGPMLDRIDIQLEAAPVKYADLKAMKGESSAEIKKRVNAAREIQKERYKNESIATNAQLSGALVEKYCPIGEAESKLLKNAFDSLGLTARAYTRILKVARTIADCDGREKINEMDIAEAIGYRSLDRKYFG